ncbi:MAG TPA: hypothetical protein VHB54_08725 [Mucilaginibacter sp.]|nr:hypothetical protein [Mucilaginibacter sp.]
MKKLLTLLILIGTLWACNRQQHTESKIKLVDSETTEVRKGTSAERLVLNNGTKWKVDLSTNNNVKNLQEILKKFRAGKDLSLPAYQKTQKELQQGIDKMISECRMSGPDHEALHKWLEPLIAQVAQLKQASTVQEAASAFRAIDTRADIYDRYFEL